MADEPTTPTEDELVEEIRAWAEKYAREHDLVLNPDERVTGAERRRSSSPRSPFLPE